MGMKSFSTTSLVAEIEKEDRIRELENIIDHQNRRIEELEFREKVLSKENLVNGDHGHKVEEESEEKSEEHNGYQEEDD